MKRTFSIIVCSLFLMQFVACNLPKYPIDDPPVVKIDTRLLGKWEAKSKGEKSDFYTLTKLNDYQYSILGRTAGKKEVDKYTGFLSDVDSARFLNVYNNEDTERSYIFIRVLGFNTGNNKLRITVVNDTNMQYLDNSKQVRKYVKEHMNNPDFYGDTATVAKVR